MTTPATTRPHTSATERAVAAVTSAAPVTTGLVAPLLDGSASVGAGIIYGAAAGILGANYMNRLPKPVTDNLPAGDIVRAHRSPLFISTLTSGMALGVGASMGPAGADALMAGFLDPASVPGIVSMGWWAAVVLVPWKLRSVLNRPKTARLQTPPKPTTAPTAAPTGPQDVLQRWGKHISHPQSGSRRGQILTLQTWGPARWTGTITAPTGASATVTENDVSSVYEVPASWIHITAGHHEGERRITVNLTMPAELNTATLSGAWKKWVSKKNGLMADTRLENIQQDPATGGEVALVVAGESLDRLHHPSRADLAGALRTTTLLISYEPRHNPREAVIRKMDHNPLERGAVFPGTHVLKANANGYIQIGPGISGFPSRIQIHDPKLGGQHVVVIGVTGAGKGGSIQLISLAHHVNGSAILYADPKGSSNPAVEKMAAFSGLGPDDAIGALRVWYHGLMFRVEESARLGMKNFVATAERPWAPLIADEVGKLLGEKAEHRKEAKFIIKAGTSLGRSLGMPVLLANQLLQLEEFAGSSAIRDNAIYGGSLILLRGDSSQKDLIDLPDNFAGCNPADIPPAWSGDRDMVYDPNIPPDDPERTFGLAFAASPGAHAEMMRHWILEDATPHIDFDNIAIPSDWPFWEQRHELAKMSVLPEDAPDEDSDGSGLGMLLTTAGAPKAPSADGKILRTLKDISDPLGIEVTYRDKTEIAALAGLEGSTFDNALSRLTKANKIHRQMKDGREVRGQYGHGPAPTDALPEN